MLSPREEPQDQRQAQKQQNLAAFHFASSKTPSVDEPPFGLSSPPKEDPLDQDSYSLNSSIASQHDSLIFERLVQDPLTSGTPVAHSLARHVSCDTFIPSSLDTTTHMINDPSSEIHEEAIGFGFSSRRPSLANLEAALSGPSPNSRRSSSTNLTNQSGFYKRGSYSQASLSRTSSNLTQQLQQTTSHNAASGAKYPSPPSTRSGGSCGAPHGAGVTCASALPPLSTTRSGSSVRSTNSPSMRNKSFCSYADIIAQEDVEMKSPIRRPSISASLSNSFSMARSNSANTQCRSPIAPPFRTRPFGAARGDEDAFSPSMEGNPMLRKNSDAISTLRTLKYAVNSNSPSDEAIDG